MRIVTVSVAVMMLAMGAGLYFTFEYTGSDEPVEEVSEPDETEIAGFGSETFSVEYEENKKMYTEWSGYTALGDSYPGNVTVKIQDGKTRMIRNELKNIATTKYFPPGGPEGERVLLCVDSRNCDYEDGDPDNIRLRIDRTMVERLNLSRDGTGDYAGRTCDRYAGRNVSTEEAPVDNMTDQLVDRFSGNFEHADIDLCIDQGLGYISRLRITAGSPGEMNHTYEFTATDFHESPEPVRTEVSASADIVCDNSTVYYTVFRNDYNEAKITVGGAPESPLNVSLSGQSFEPWDPEKVYSYEEPEGGVVAYPIIDGERFPRAGSSCL